MTLGAIKWEARSVAPQTFAEVLRSWHEKRRIIVWNGGSEKTIHPDPRNNFLFRAWHDYGHILLRANFRLEGETRVYQWQSNGQGTLLQRALKIEIVEQAAHYWRTKTFVEEQKKFFLTHWKKGGI
jgi:hypothetical protein